MFCRCSRIIASLGTLLIVSVSFSDEPKVSETSQDAKLDVTASDQAEKPIVVDWIRETDKAEWQPRDSCGEVVFRDKLWIMGGWIDSYSSPPRDVWSSANGKTWERVVAEAPWKYSDLAMAVTFQDRIWMLGGWYNGRIEGHGATNEVWSSGDGSHWELATQKAGWTPRIAAGLVEFNGRMWVLGGTENYYFGDNNSLKNDVWSSANGKDWKLETTSAPWSARAYLQAIVHHGKMWVMGGGNYVPEYHAKNDVWCSDDGITWELATDAAPWSPRLWFSSVAYRDQMWVIGGWSNNPSQNQGDVWHSKDGRTWKQLQSDTMWKARHEHSAYVFHDKIWVAGGHASPLNSEVWSLQLPAEFSR